MKASAEWRYSSTHSSPRHWVEMSDQLYALVALHLRKVPSVSAGWEVLWASERRGIWFFLPGVESRCLGHSARTLACQLPFTVYPNEYVCSELTKYLSILSYVLSVLNCARCPNEMGILSCGLVPFWKELRGRAVGLRAPSVWLHDCNNSEVVRLGIPIRHCAGKSWALLFH